MLQVNPALAVPEPATWALLLVALLTLGARGGLGARPRERRFRG